MTKRQRAINSVFGGLIDRVPSGFWLHFSEDCFSGSAAVDAHKEYFENVDTDIFKIMNENLIPAAPIRSIRDLESLSRIPKNSKFLQDQLDITKRIVEYINGRAVVLSTIHGVVASSHHIMGGADYFFTNRHTPMDYLRVNPEGMEHLFDVVSETLEYLTIESLKAGVDGIYYTAFGGEDHMFTNEEHARYVRPYDERVLAAAKNRPGFNVLHICKDNLHLERFINYDVDVVNWGVFEHNPPLTHGKIYFPGKALLGGLDDRAGVLVNGSTEDIENAVFNILEEMGTSRFILGADCTLPSDINYKRINTAIHATEKYLKRE